MRHPTRVRARAAKDFLAAGATTEAQMLLVMADPHMRHKGVAAKAAKAGVSRATWYRHVSNPLFQARTHTVCQPWLFEYLGPVLHALTETAKLPGRKGHLDRKLYLELVGFTAPERPSPEVGGTPKSAEAMTDAELLACFEGHEYLLPASLRQKLGLHLAADADQRPCPPASAPVTTVAAKPEPRLSVFDAPKAGRD